MLTMMNINLYISHMEYKLYILLRYMYMYIIGLVLHRHNHKLNYLGTHTIKKEIKRKLN